MSKPSIAMPSIGAVVVDREHGFGVPQPRLVRDLGAHGDALRELAADADAAVVGPGAHQDQAAVGHAVQRVGDRGPGASRAAAAGRIDAVGRDVEGLRRRVAAGREREQRDEAGERGGHGLRLPAAAA